MSSECCLQISFSRPINLCKMRWLLPVAASLEDLPFVHEDLCALSDGIDTNLTIRFSSARGSMLQGEVAVAPLYQLPAEEIARYLALGHLIRLSLSRLLLVLVGIYVWIVKQLCHCSFRSGWWPLFLQQINAGID